MDTNFQTNKSTYRSIFAAIKHESGLIILIDCCITLCLFEQYLIETIEQQYTLMETIITMALTIMCFEKTTMNDTYLVT